MSFIFSNDQGSFMLKTRTHEDNTVTSKFYKVSFDGIGSILCENTFGVIYEADINGMSMLYHHEAAFSTLTERYESLNLNI